MFLRDLCETFVPFVLPLFTTYPTGGRPMLT